MRGRSSSKLQLTPCAAGILVGLSACGGDSGRGPAVVVPRRDAGTEQDASNAADADAASGDASALGDAALPYEEDGGPKEPFDPREDCKVVEERSELAIPVTFGDETGFSITPGLTGFGVAYQSDNCAAINVLPVASVGTYPVPKTLFANCDAVARGVSLLYLGQGYRLGWIDSATGSAELQTLQLPASLDLPASPTRTPLTNNEVRELAPVQASIASTAYLGWISQDDSGARSILLQGAGASEPRTLVASDKSYVPLRLALAQLGDSTGALAFVSEEQKKGVWLVRLSATGEPSEPVQLQEGVTAGNTVDLATRTEDGGALVYSLELGGRQEIRFRRLNTLGEVISDDVKVVTFPLQGRDASISRLGGGYVIAFRSPRNDDPERADIRITFVTKEGNVQRDSAGNVASYVIAEASSTGGRITARVSSDGQLLVGFLDSAPAGAQGAQFRLLRKRFDCAL
jgi:hypothetical protein